ncbi:MAG: hypothetical protein IJT94_13555, partial [Oscillibacter sp.]|nr:hypothetical protein [Oscillibacter sp.]
MNDKAYNKLGFSIHNYFFAKALDQVRSGGVVAFITSHHTMDAKSTDVRKYLSQRAELLGAVRLPDNAFKSNAGTDVVTDIIFLQKRDHPIEKEQEWVHLARSRNGYPVNCYFVKHPDMILGNQSSKSTPYGERVFTVKPFKDRNLSDLLREALRNIRGTIQNEDLPELGESESLSNVIPADPDVKNFSYTLVEGEPYYRQNSVMVRAELSATAKERLRGMVELRDCVHRLIDLQMDEAVPDSAIRREQETLNRLYDTFSERFGLINSAANRRVFSDDSSYYLLCSLEALDEDGNMERKADIFTKRTIKQRRSVSHVDTAAEALAVSIGERACVDLGFMASLMSNGTPEDRAEKIPQIVQSLRGVIYKDPATGPFDYAQGGEHWAQGWQTADEYLSGNVRRKLREAKTAAEQFLEFQANVEALEQAQPKDLDATEIEVRLGTTWIDRKYFEQFMRETLRTPRYYWNDIRVEYSPMTADWNITNKSWTGKDDVTACSIYGTERANG